MKILGIILARSAGEAFAGGAVQGLIIGVIYLIYRGIKSLKSKSIKFEEGGSIDSISRLNSVSLNDIEEETQVADSYELKTTTNEIDEFSDKYDKLRFLKSLLDENILTQEEFNEEKQKILNNVPSIIFDAEKVESLRLIKKLQNDGVLTQNEFDIEKGLILGI